MVGQYLGLCTHAYGGGGGGGHKVWHCWGQLLNVRVEHQELTLAVLRQRHEKPWEAGNWVEWGWLVD